jgi:hypothetical protein
MDEFPNCILCRGCVELENHLFLTYLFVWDILLDSFLSSIKRGIRKYTRDFIWPVWHAVVWVIWHTRNDKIFKIKEPVLGDVFDRIKCTSWKLSPCMYYEWHVNPWYIVRLLVCPCHIFSCFALPLVWTLGWVLHVLSYEDE